ncbi:hypothetical protein NI465_01420 [Acinetobacter lwoffii]|uniref:hypothetical protein n=1 Tax=Acinetobacter lwoffii TaxID=28090 RepID=UPI00209B4DDD|nr:hypothetical protein [Acinetobacter lwoffii]MCO8112866.1 hypothetical protein [Acinetobacter lwoffii]
MIKTKKAERLIHAAGGLKQAKLILANVPDKTAFFYQLQIGLYARTGIAPQGVVTSVFLGGKWVIWGNPYDLIKLSELRRAAILLEKANVLDEACNDSQIDIKLHMALQKFTMGDYVVYLDLMDTDDLLKIIEIHNHPVNGIGYVVITHTGLKRKIPEGSIRKAMSQERLIKKRINHIDEALTVSEVEFIRRHVHA